MNSLIKWLKVTNQYNKTDEDEKPSHLSLNGYTLYVKKENISIFNKKYSESLQNGDKMYIVECRKSIFKLFFDLDFLLTQDQYSLLTEKSQYDTEDVFLEFINIINDVIYEYYDRYYDCIVTTADIKKVKKICKNNDNPENFNSEELIKKGYHLHFPDICIDKNYALEIRKTCLTRLSKYKDVFYNSVADIVDEHVFVTSGLRLTGSNKGHYISQTKEFIDEGRPYKLLYILTNTEINEELFKELKNNMEELVNKTSIITSQEYITNIKNNPNLDCEETEYDSSVNNLNNSGNSGSWKRLQKDDVRHIEILRFFNIYVKDYTIKDIKRIFYSENECIYILCSQSKYCTNIGRNHNSEHIYFKLNKDGICQRCFCRCDTLDGRKHGYCKDYKSDIIPCTPQLKKILNFKDIKLDKTKILKNNKINNSDLNVNTVIDNLLSDWYNQFTNKTEIPRKRKTKFT